MYSKGRAKNWLSEEETALVDGYMENKEDLTCELKGASNINGKKTAQKRRHLVENH